MTSVLPFWGPNIHGGYWYVALSFSVIDLSTFTHVYYIRNVQPHRICYTGMLVCVHALCTDRCTECRGEQRWNQSQATVQHHSIRYTAAFTLQQQDEKQWRQQKQPLGLPTNACEPIPLHSWHLCS
jgi:hypothetical protein